jgi:antitoxin FitA
MPTPITICEVPDEVREELAARAALSGRSLEDYVRSELIALAQRPSAAVWMARVRARCMGEPPAGERGLESGVDHDMSHDVDHHAAARRDVG